MKEKQQRIPVKRRELWLLLFWAGYGLSRAHGGTGALRAIDLINYFNRKYRFQLQRPMLGEYRP